MLLEKLGQRAVAGFGCIVCSATQYLNHQTLIVMLDLAGKLASGAWEE